MFNLEAVVMNLLVLIISIVVPRIDILMAFIGGTFAVLVSYVLPALMFIKLQPPGEYKQRKWRVHFVLVLALGITSIAMLNLARTVHLI